MKATNSVLVAAITLSFQQEITEVLVAAPGAEQGFDIAVDGFHQEHSVYFARGRPDHR